MGVVMITGPMRSRQLVPNPFIGADVFESNGGLRGFPHIGIIFSNEDWSRDREN